MFLLCSLNPPELGNYARQQSVCARQSQVYDRQSAIRHCAGDDADRQSATRHCAGDDAGADAPSPTPFPEQMGHRNAKWVCSPHSQHRLVPRLAALNTSAAVS